MCEITGSEFWPAWLRGGRVKCHGGRGGIFNETENVCIPLLSSNWEEFTTVTEKTWRIGPCLLFFPAAISYFLEVPGTVGALLKNGKDFLFALYSKC